MFKKKKTLGTKRKQAKIAQCLDHIKCADINYQETGNGVIVGKFIALKSLHW